MTTSVSPCVSLEGVDCGYGEKVVVSGCSLSIGPGEVVALIGPNGSGKSTLMKTIAGAVRPLRGTVRVLGDDVTGLSKREIARRIGYVPQIESPAFDFRVRDVVLMGRLPHSDGMFETSDDKKAAVHAMERAGCVGLAHRPMSELSGGEGQRVRIARALAQSAPVLLMDEPTTHLDVRHQIDIGHLVRDLARSGLAVLVAVHDLNWAASFATRAALLHDGKTAFDLEIGEALESPLLDRAFGVKFDRIKQNGTRLLADEGV